MSRKRTESTTAAISGSKTRTTKGIDYLQQTLSSRRPAIRRSRPASPISSASRILARVLHGLQLLFAMALLAPCLQAQESPYIVTYDHYLEEPGSLEVE